MVAYLPREGETESEGAELRSLNNRSCPKVRVVVLLGPDRSLDCEVVESARQLGRGKGGWRVRRQGDVNRPTSQDDR
jgi:hypothetical protein